MIVYVASPYSKGDKLSNVRSSLLAADQLVKLGHIPYCPLLTHFWDEFSPKPYEWWLEYDLTWLLKCDAVLRLPGDSSGADKEVEFALAHDIPVYYSLEGL